MQENGEAPPLCKLLWKRKLVLESSQRMGNKGHEAFRFKKKEDENFTGYCQRTARAVRTIWTKMKLPFLSEVIAEGTWRGVGWTCDPKPTAVLTTLKHAFKWRCTKVVAEYTSIRNHRGLVQPHDMENTRGADTVVGVSGTRSPPNGLAKMRSTRKKMPD